MQIFDLFYTGSNMDMTSMRVKINGFKTQTEKGSEIDENVILI